MYRRHVMLPYRKYRIGRLVVFLCLTRFCFVLRTKAQPVELWGSGLGIRREDRYVLILQWCVVKKRERERIVCDRLRLVNERVWYEYFVYSRARYVSRFFPSSSHPTPQSQSVLSYLYVDFDFQRGSFWRIGSKSVQSNSTAQRTRNL